MSCFIFDTVELVTLEELDTAVQLLDTPSPSLKNSSVYDDIWPELYHPPDRPHHCFIKYSESFQYDTLLFWSYLDPGNRKLFYSWCVRQGFINEALWGPRRLWNAAHWLLAVYQYLGLSQCITIWGTQRGMDKSKQFAKLNRSVLSFYQQLSDSDKKHLYQWMRDTIQLLNEGKSPCFQ